ncbi:putative all-trans-nonaprenyl-diphosphate synthase (geranylgeranyl-diphosphate specific) [Helianthus anomalus]
MKNTNPIYSVQFISNEKEIYYTYEITATVIQRILVLPGDTAVHLRWMDQIQDWAVHAIGPQRKPRNCPSAILLYGIQVAVLAGGFMFAQSSWYLANLESLEVIKLIRRVYHCIVLFLLQNRSDKWVVFGSWLVEPENLIPTRTRH